MFRPDASTFSTENHSKYVRHASVGRCPSLRRPTNLKLEGELLTTTEKAEQFIEFLLSQRPHITRKPTNLKLEGEMGIKTENREKYIPFEYQKRPPLCKKWTNLHLEGNLDLLTENNEKYVPFDVQERPSLTRRDSNLHLEGDLQMSPEYRSVFKEYKVERAKPTLPVNNLKTEGMFDLKTETTSKFLDHHVHPTIPFLRGCNKPHTFILGDDSDVKKPEYKDSYVEYSGAERSTAHRPDEHLKQEGTMETVTENKKQYVEKPASKTEMRKAPNNLLLEGRIDMNPEYRNAYVNFYRDSNKPAPRSRRVSQSTTSFKNEGDIEINPEYRNAYVNFPRERPRLRKPDCSLSSEGEVSLSYSFTTGKVFIYLFILTEM